MSDILKVVLTGFLGLATGAIGSLVAPWVKWGIEKKKLIREERKSLIAMSRAIMLDMRDVLQFSGTIQYSQIQPWLSDELNDLLKVIHFTRDNGIQVNPKSQKNRAFIKQKLLQELVELEKQFGIL